MRAGFRIGHPAFRTAGPRRIEHVLAQLLRSEDEPDYDPGSLNHAAAVPAAVQRVASGLHTPVQSDDRNEDDV